MLGLHIGGDVFSYVMQRDGVEFGEALKNARRKSGIELQAGNRKKAAPGSPDDKSALQAALQFAVNAYYEFLQNDPPLKPPWLATIWPAAASTRPVASDT